MADTVSNDAAYLVDEELDDSLEKPSAACQKTFVSVFHEFCTKFGFGVPMYNLVKEFGDSHKKTFLMSLTINTLGISVLGSGSTKMQAKHDAAYKMMLQIRKTAQAGGNLNEVTNEKLLTCSEWITKCVSLNDDDVPHELKEPTNSAGILTSWLLTEHHPLPEYQVVKTCGPPHSRTYFMTCKLLEHVTEGEGKSKKVAKNIAAAKMLTILQSKNDY